MGQMNTFYKLMFHTNQVEFSQKAQLALGPAEANALVERHFTGDWGYLDEADTIRNEKSLRDKSGLVRSSFHSNLGDHTLIVDSDLTGHTTFAFLLGEPE